MNFGEIKVEEILPQRPPFIMISQLVHYDEVYTVTRFAIEPDNLFCENGQMVASGLVENFAQTCAARIGYINKYILKKGVNIGFIGAVKSLEVHQLPKVDDTIETRIEVLTEQFGLTLARGEIRLLDGTLIAEGEMKIALSEKTIEA